ncbi:PREDICTED: cyclic AMP receptor-like protein A [Amphimedon queenslandica]|uniref:G-protein coupled receptors family 2 profile 2 domain-containing protein n=1 Tax=Amphimedon queenslandica TaxID=400682 RepID=A0A1X7UQ89_AMPQE|nr:PREDICTED: cyclic AMP receptor-like protein A [Amphimedon queenslandica]|eukprot:XP_011404380.1 PREDICTED: cyclic AMP receptor-like protein A [Amphimedon queenslandica]
MNNSSSTTDGLCGYANFTPVSEDMILAILHTSSAGISFISSVLVIILIILFKKYSFFVQRLILYLSFSVLLYSIASALAVTNYTGDEKVFPDNFCEAIGFVTQYTQWTLLLSVAVITIDILLRVILNRATNSIEILYLIFIYVFPATFNWAPFLQGLYGPAGSWCWIRSYTLNESGDCVKNETGLIYQFSLWYGPLFVVLVLISVSYIIILSTLKRYKQRMNIYNHDEMELLKKMKREVFILMWYPIIFALINLIPLANRIIHACLEHEKRIYVLWVLHAFVSPLQGAFVVIVYALDPETRRKLTVVGVRGALSQHCSCFNGHRGIVREYKAEVLKSEGGPEARRPLLKDK